MEHKGIIYTIRVRIERGTWLVSIHPPDEAKAPQRIVAGTRRKAELEARSMIGSWLQKKAAQCRQNSN
jgi:hypothetical protein